MSFKQDAKPQQVQSTTRKAYSKPTWEKQEIFERFTLGCHGRWIKTYGSCSKIGS